MTSYTDDPATEFEDEGWTPDYLPVSDALIGETQAENYKHAIARTTLLNELVLDERVEATFQKWGEWTGINDAANRLARALEELAIAAGLGHRELFVEAYEKGSPQQIAELNGALVRNCCQSATLGQIGTRGKVVMESQR